MTLDPAAVSYAALFRIPGFARIATGTLLARLVAQMYEIVLVLFVLQRYQSPSLAGLAVLLSLAPGLVLSPVAGALLDRQGRIRLMILDYATTATLLAAMALLSTAHRLPSALLLVVVTVLSVSNILSITGTRSLFPLMVPARLWDRANGWDSSSYALTGVVGPAIAGLLVAGLGPETALLLIAIIAAVATIPLIGVKEPMARVVAHASLLGDAWQGLLYVVRHPSLRGLAIALFLSNLAYGALPVGVPVLVLHRLQGSAANVGEVFALFGFTGLVASLLVGRIDTRGREKFLIAACIVVQAPVIGLLPFAPNLPVLFALAAVGGAAGSASNVAIFALRQRRTDPAWFGRAFAVSMSLNISGQPIGSALSGPLLERSLAAPFMLGAFMTLLAAAATLSLIPVQGRVLARSEVDEGVSQ